MRMSDQASVARARRRSVVRRVGCMLAMAAAVNVAGPASGMWRTPTDAPVGRLIANVGAYTKEHPEDANGFYVLGRVHGLAFTLKTSQVSTWGRGESDSDLPKICPDDFQRGWGRVTNQPPTQEELLVHLKESVLNYQKAVALDPKPAHYHLGLAYVVEQGTALAEKADVVPRGAGADKAQSEARTAELEAWVKQLGDTSAGVREKAAKKLRESLDEAAPVLLKHRAEDDAVVCEQVRMLLEEQWRENAIAQYLLAYERAIAEDLKIEEQPMRGLRVLVGYEAGKAYIRLVKARGVKPGEEAKKLARVEADMATLEKKPPNGAITPIILSLEGQRALDELLEPGMAVKFDLDGDGVAEMWPWVRPGTGFLVWDPAGKGKITSGLQLFGSVTWWMFFEDGYHALDALDDDRDGRIAGAELRGLAVWFDRDSDGVSGPGEVVPVEMLGISAIRSRAVTMVGDSPANPAGLEMSDGRVLPTYDWVTSPVENDGSGARENAAAGGT